jgi:hypothetical protein
MLAVFTSRADRVPVSALLAGLSERGIEASFASRLGSTGDEDWEVGTFTAGGADVEASTRPIGGPELDEIAADYAATLGGSARDVLLAASREYRLDPADDEADALVMSLADVVARKVGGLVLSLDDGGCRVVATEPRAS